MNIRLKMKWLLLLPILLTPPYVITNRIRLFDPVEVPKLAFDLSIPFMPEFSWLYLGLFPFMWWALMQQNNLLDTKRYVIGGSIIAWTVSIIFLFFPTTFVRPIIEPEGLYSLILLSSCKRHTLHHTKFNGNYGFFLPWLDQIFKTEI